MNRSGAPARNICLAFSYQKNYTEALEFDKANNNSKWYDATKAELGSIHSYEVFKKHEKAQYDKQKKVINAPPGYQKIKVHLIFAVSMMADIEPDLLLMDILLQNVLKVFTQELFH